MRFFGTKQQDHRREAQPGSQASARLRLVSERASCSPRATVAFSALSTVTWLRNKASELVRRITLRIISTGRPKLATETENITLDAQGN
jgi:hypothetical protein